MYLNAIWDIGKPGKTILPFQQEDNSKTSVPTTGDSKYGLSRLTEIGLTAVTKHLIFHKPGGGLW